jgi:hypothetical protein
MGDVVGKKAAAETIMADVETTYEKAKARGGKWFELAERMIGGPMMLKATLATQLREAEAEVRPLLAAVEAQDDAADKLVGQISDDAWNAIGRPASDPTYEVVFPNGIGYYTEGPDAEQPHRMELLAQLLEMKMLARLPAAQAASMGKRLRDMAAAYRKVIEPVAAPRSRLQMLERATTALAHSSQIALAQLKRLYRAEGFTEAEIHTVIPDRPRKKASAATPPTPSPAPGGI